MDENHREDIQIEGTNERRPKVNRQDNIVSSDASVSPNGKSERESYGATALLKDSEVGDVDVVADSNHKTPTAAKGGNFITDFWSKYKGDKIYAATFRHSICLAISLFALGVVESQGGSTFLDLQIITDTTVGQASAFFTSHSVGYLLGSSACGYLSGFKVNASLILLISMLAMGIGVIILPYCSPYIAMIFMRCFTGISGGFIDTTANAEHMRLWGKDGHVLMQLLHFCFALGGVVSPLVTEPFLAERAEDNRSPELCSAANGTNLSTGKPCNYSLLESYSVVNRTDELMVEFTYIGSISNTSVSPYGVNSSYYDAGLESSRGSSSSSRPTTTDVRWAFLITGTIVLLTSIPFFFLYAKSRRDMRKRKKLQSEKLNKGTDAKEDSNGERYRKVPRRVFLQLVCGIFLFYLFYCSVEDTFASFLMTFVVRRFQHVSKSDGAHITAVYWASFAISRLAMIFVSKLLKTPVRVIYMGGSLMLVAFAGFAISSGPWIGAGTEVAGEEGGGSVPALTFFAALAGLGLSGVFPAGLSWAGAELLEVSGRVSACVFVAASIGAMVNPLIVSRLMENVSNMWFCYLLLLEVTSLAIVFITLLLFNRCFVNKRFGKLHVEHSSEVEQIRDGESHA